MLVILPCLLVLHTSIKFDNMMLLEVVVGAVVLWNGTTNHVLVCSAVACWCDEC